MVMAHTENKQKLVVRSKRYVVRGNLNHNRKPLDSS